MGPSRVSFIVLWTFVRSVLAVSQQNPPVWDALANLKGANNARALTVDQIQDLYYNARAGEDFPILAEIPPNNIDCQSYHQPGFYADSGAGRCQVFHRCDINGNKTSYLCPNMTLFNQITLVCDWWYNVDCSQSDKFWDYSNSRLYQGSEVRLLDDQDVFRASGAAAQDTGYRAQPAPRKQKKRKNGQQRQRQQQAALGGDISVSSYAPQQGRPGPGPYQQ